MLIVGREYQQNQIYGESNFYFFVRIKQFSSFILEIGIKLALRVLPVSSSPLL